MTTTENTTEAIDTKAYVAELTERAARGARACSLLSTVEKNSALLAIADGLEARSTEIIEENEKDLAAGRENKLSTAMLDRLGLDVDRIKAMADGTRHVASLADPCGRVLDGSVLDNGLRLQKVSVPLGVIMMIYESRPNVTIDAGVLCFKSGNACILRCGREAHYSTQILGKIIQDSLEGAGFCRDIVQVVDRTDREVINQLLREKDKIDLVIPRGGHGLIEFVTENSLIPVIKHYLGICHTYVHGQVDVQMACDIAINAKTHRPGVCNAMETLLVDQACADLFLPIVISAMKEKGVELRVCERVSEIFPKLARAKEEDWKTEYLSLTLSVKMVDNIDAAITHINTYGSGHSDAIVTSDYRASQQFTQEVDSSTVYVNASTRFTDGAVFGLGAEIGISTDKLHARGPMGLAELTTHKFIVCGDGQIRS